MITKTELKNRVEDRKRELEAQRETLFGFRERITKFAEDIRSRSVIYNMVRNLTVWKELEELISNKDHNN